MIGGGATGTELAVEIAVQYPEKEVTLVHSGQTLVNDQTTQNFQNKLKNILDRYHVKCKLGRSTKNPDTQSIKGSFTHSDCDCESDCDVASHCNHNRTYGLQSHFCDCDCDDL